MSLGQNADELAKAAAAIPASTFFERTAVDALRISPDGRQIAFVYQHDGHRALALFDRKSGAVRQIVSAKDGDVTGSVWKGNDHLLIFASFLSGALHRVLLTDLTGKNLVRMDEQPGFGRLRDSRPFDPRRVLIDDANGLYLFDLFARKRQIVLPSLEGKDDTDYGWLADNDGKVRMFLRDHERHIHLMTGDGEPKHFVEAASWNFDGYAGIAPVERIWLAGDGAKIYVIARTEHDRGALYAIDTVTGKWSEALFVPPDGEITGLFFSPDRATLEGISYETDRQHYHWFDADWGKSGERLEQSFPEKLVHIVSQSGDGQIVVVLVTSDREAGQYYIADRSTGKIETFVGGLLNLDPKLMRPMEPIVFKARDGLELHGYLTRPWAAGDGSVPLVVRPHSGPYDVRDTWGFDRDVQFLASRGYAVVEVNYRGSRGYGADFIRKGRFQWGREMQNDLTDAVRWLVTEGVADPKRVAIIGKRYGGYAALAGVTLTPELYRCAVNLEGYTDLEITWHPPGTDVLAPSRYYDYRVQWIGANRADRDRISPLQNIDKIQVPTLHAYWEDESRVDQDHWKRLKAALTKAKKEFEFVTTEEGRPHQFDWVDADIKYHERLEAFLAKNLAPTR